VAAPGRGTSFARQPQTIRWFGTARVFVCYCETVGPAPTALPALIAVVAGEAADGRGCTTRRGLSLAAIPILAAPEMAELSSILASHAMTIFATAGFAGGLLYWLLAGARA
jgi:hypothetical protein